MVNRQNTKIKKDIITAVKRYADYISSNGFTIRGLYIFGSYARGNAQDTSDIDICVISDSFKSDEITGLQKLLRLARKADIRIEPVMLTSAEFGDNISPLVYEIKKYGYKI